MRATTVQLLCDQVQISFKMVIAKKGQGTMGMPFGVIFSIFLIIVFVAIAFIAVEYFLDIGRASSVGMFYSELQEEIDEAWTSQSTEINFEVDLPSGIKTICFANLSNKITMPGEDYQMIEKYKVYDANVFLLPPEKTENMPWKTIKHSNLTKIIEERNPYCLEVSNGLKIKKDFYDKLVVIE